MLDYDMIASTNCIPFMYVPNDVTEPDAPACPAGGRGDLGKTHIDYLNAKLNITAGRLPVRQPVRLRPVAPPVGDPRRARDRLLHRRRGHQDRPQVADNAASTAGTGGQAGIQADPCYHEWCDTVFNLSEYGLDEFTDVLAHGMLSFAGVGTDAVEIPVRPEN